MSPFNLFKKPQLAPPINLTEPDFRKLDALRDKYQNEAKKFANLKLEILLAGGELRRLWMICSF